MKSVYFLNIALLYVSERSTGNWKEVSISLDNGLVCWSGNNHHLSQWWRGFTTWYGNTRPQRVNKSVDRTTLSTLVPKLSRSPQSCHCHDLFPLFFSCHNYTIVDRVFTELTHWGPVIHICLSMKGSTLVQVMDYLNGISPVWCQCINCILIFYQTLRNKNFMKLWWNTKSSSIIRKSP